MTNRLIVLALLLIVARMLYWQRPPGDDFHQMWVYAPDGKGALRKVG